MGPKLSVSLRVDLEADEDFERAMVTLDHRWDQAPARLLFFAEAVEPHDLGALGGLVRLVFGLFGGHRQRGRRGRGCRLALFGRWRDIRGLELQAELHGRIEEALDGAEGNDQPLRNA